MIQYRQFVSDVINGLMVDLQEKNTFQSLFSAVEEQRKKKAQLLDIINRSYDQSFTQTYQMILIYNLKQ